MRPIFERNRNPAGRKHNFMFGLIQIVDGLVRVTTFGFMRTNLLNEFTRSMALRQINKQKSSVLK